MNILPVVGSSGFYEFQPPFNVESEGRVEYTCIAIRRISDYLANNEDVQKDIYDAREISPDIWEEDLKADSYIVSLQTRNGHLIYVPYRYITSFPSINGVPYRTMHVGIALPAMPVTQDFTALTDELKSVTEHLLGVNCVVRMVESSKVQIVPFEDHEQAIQQRIAASQDHTNVYGMYLKERAARIALEQKRQELEAYILAHHTTP